MIVAITATTRSGASTRILGSNSIPTETKNSTEKASWSGSDSRAQDHPGEERAERERDVEQRGGAVGDSDRDCDHAQGEELARARVRDLPQEPGQQSAADEPHEGRESGDLGERQCESADEARVGDCVLSATVEPARERRQQDEREHHREVLDDQPADRDAAVHRCEQVAVLERADQHHRACDREREAEHESTAPAPAPERRQRHPEQRRDRDLRDRARYRNAAHLEQVVEREMHSDAEHEQHHADLGQLARELDVRDEARRGRADRDAREQIPDQHRQPQTRGHDTEDQREAERGRDRRDQRDAMGHAP
jgi:hypothetical protein